jgi:hypothetical protein
VARRESSATSKKGASAQRRRAKNLPAWLLVQQREEARVAHDVKAVPHHAKRNVLISETLRVVLRTTCAAVADIEGDLLVRLRERGGTGSALQAVRRRGRGSDG